jgi:hypothetical protein
MASDSVRIILAPDVLARAFVDPACKAVLDLWRDENVVPVVTWDLLQRYLRLLRKFGLSDELLRKWTMWFTARGKTVCILEPRTCAATTPEGVLNALAVSGPAVVVSTLARPETCGGVSWVTPLAFVRELGR